MKVTLIVEIEGEQFPIGSGEVAGGTRDERIRELADIFHEAAEAINGRAWDELA